MQQHDSISYLYTIDPDVIPSSGFRGYSCSIQPNSDKIWWVNKIVKIGG